MIAGKVRPSNARLAIGVVAAFVATNVAGTMIAMAMNPLVAPAFGSFLRDPEREGLHVPALVGGYAVVTGVLAALHLRFGGDRARDGARLGLLLGLAVFLGGHLITAGWSTLPAGAMAISGGLDALAVAVGGGVLAFAWRAQHKMGHVHAP